MCRHLSGQSCESQRRYVGTHYYECISCSDLPLCGGPHEAEPDTAANISAAARSLIGEWGFEGKMASIVTDAGANMLVSVRKLNLRHAPLPQPF